MNRLLLCIGLWLLTLVDIHSQVLYRVSSNPTKAPSYILATNKLIDIAFLDTIPNVFKCFSDCDKVITEFAMQDYEAIAALRQAALLPDSVQLRNFYTDLQYKEIDEALRTHLGMGLDKLGRMKPSYLTEMFRNELLKKWLESLWSRRYLRQICPNASSLPERRRLLRPSSSDTIFWS